MTGFGVPTGSDQTSNGKRRPNLAAEVNLTDRQNSASELRSMAPTWYDSGAATAAIPLKEGQPKHSNPSPAESASADPTGTQQLRAEFERIFSERSTGSGDPRGGRPERLEQVLELYLSRGADVSLDELAELFGGTKNPRKRAANTMSWLKRLFDEHNADFEIRSEVQHKVIYHFEPRLNRR